MLTMTTEIPSTKTAHATKQSWGRIKFTEAMRAKGGALAADKMRHFPKGTFPLPCVSITLWISYPNRQQRDNQNIIVAFKGFIDGMVDAGMIRDDNNQVLVQFAARTAEICSPNPRVLVHVVRDNPPQVFEKPKAKKVKK